MTNINGVALGRRCQDSTMQLAVHIRVPEGQQGHISIYVVPRNAPRTCEVVRHPIRSLCLHRRASAGVTATAHSKDWVKRSC